LSEENVNLIVKATKSYKESENLEELLNIIKGYSGLGFYEEVKKHTEEFLEKGGNLGDLIGVSKDMPEQMKNIICTGGLEIEGEFDADSFLEMGELLWEIGSPDEAKDNYIKAFEYYSFLGNGEAAQQVLKTLKEKYPEDRNIKALVFKDTRGEIIIKLKAFVSEPPKDEVDLRYALGREFHGENMLSEAEANYRRILELDNSHNSKRLLVALLRQKGSLGDSLSLARELGEEEKLEELYAIYESLRDSGKLKVSEDVLKEIYGINPDFKNVKELLGKVSVEEKLEEVPVDIFSEQEKEEKEVKVVKEVKVGDVGPKDEGFEEKKIVFL
jgi:tetratricopeptide (TPR) repeat protein